jgi:hypothetical protein
MKTSIRFVCISVVILIFAGFTSCKKDSGSNGFGTIEFSMNLPAQLKSTNTDSANVSYQLMISVEDNKGNLIFTD